VKLQLLMHSAVDTAVEDGIEVLSDRCDDLTGCGFDEWPTEALIMAMQIAAIATAIQRRSFDHHGAR
jgi:hypothetical protein